MRKRYSFLIFGLASCAVTDRSAIQFPHIRPLFDVPSLLGKSIDQVHALLGQSQTHDLEPTPAQVQLGAGDWDKSFVRDSATLLVTYDAKTRRVTDFYLTTTHGQTADYTPLLRLANVKGNEHRLRIEPVPLATNNQLYTGVKFVVQK